MNKIDLDKPDDARKFLRGIKIRGGRIEFVVLESGKQLSIEEMSDDQVVRYAKDVYLDYCGGTEGEGGHVELEGVDQ